MADPLLKFRARVGEFISRMEDDRYAAAVGRIRAVPLARRYSAAAELFSLDRIAEIQRALAGSAGQEERDNRVLLGFAARGHAWAAGAAEAGERLEWVTSASIKARDFEIALHNLHNTLARTQDVSVRRAIEETALRELAEHAALAEDAIARHREGLEELGYGSHIRTIEVLGGLDLHALAATGETLLQESQALFEELLGWQLPRSARVTLESAAEGDLPRVEQAASFEEALTGGSVFEEALRLVGSTGLDVRAEGGIVIDPAVRLRGGPGGVCHAPEVPERVLLGVEAGPGRRAWIRFLRALGLALHQGYTDQTLSIERRYLGDPSVPEATGRLLGTLLGTPDFLVRLFRMPRGRAAEYGRSEALALLLEMRRDVALLIYSIDSYNDGAGPDRYVDLLTRATGVRHDERGAVWAVEPELGSAIRIRAAQLGAIHSTVLRERYDEDWYRNPSSGGYLRDLFSNGRRYSALELSVQLGSPTLGFRPWLDEVERLASG